jgi:tripartite-type tricarboxylate transporter receptor subunit TctC
MSTLLVSWTAILVPALAVSLTAALPVQAQPYPSRPIRFIVPYTPGGLGDSFARAVGEDLAKRMGQPVVIDNRPGASQAIGAEATAKAPPDGHTIFLGTQSGLVVNTIARRKLPTIRCAISPRSRCCSRRRSTWWSTRRCRPSR